MDASSAVRSPWRIALAVLNRPFPLRARVVVPLVTLWVIVPFYLVIGRTAHGLAHHPELALDRALPVIPFWALIYVSHIPFIFAPVLVVRHEEQLRRTFLAYLSVWVFSFAVFILYPTILPRPAIASLGRGFFAWCLENVYQADAPRNNFPSLHVAHAFISACTCYLASRRLGFVTGLWATLIAISTVLTKQHYVADVISGIALAGVASAMFLRNSPRDVLTEPEERGALLLVVGLAAIFTLAVAGVAIYYFTSNSTTTGR